MNIPVISIAHVIINGFFRTYAMVSGDLCSVDAMYSNGSYVVTNIRWRCSDITGEDAHVQQAIIEALVEPGEKRLSLSRK